jgi:hypothetical protein
MLVKAAMKTKEITYLNISPDGPTRKTIIAQGFECYVQGMYAAFPLLPLFAERAKIRSFDPARDYDGSMSPDEITLLAEHAGFGCTALVCESAAEILPFVFVRRRVYIGPVPIPYAYLCYCRHVDDFRRFAGPLGRALLLRGMFFALVDADNDLPGIPGRFFGGRGPKFFRGPCPPRLGDLSYTEAALFEPGYG